MAKTKVAKPNTFTIDCTKPSSDGIFDVAAFEKYLTDRIKVEGRTNNLGENVVITKTGTVLKLVISSDVKFAKRYIKYLAKKFLKKNQLRDWLRVVANTKQGYELRYYNIAGDDEEEEE